MFLPKQMVLSSTLVDLPLKAGHFLKLLSAITQPFRQSPDPLPAIEETVRDALCTALANKFCLLKGAFD